MRKFFGLGNSTPPTPPLPTTPPPAPLKAATIVGRWKEPNGKDVTEFHADKTVTEKPATGENIRGRYSLDGSKLKIDLDGVPDHLSFTAVIKGDTLEMTGPDGSTTRYERAS
ncbi:MAG: hypothetical protein ABI946_10880 [Chthoniobacterales bacterium]